MLQVLIVTALERMAATLWKVKPLQLRKQQTGRFSFATEKKKQTKKEQIRKLFSQTIEHQFEVVHKSKNFSS